MSNNKTTKLTAFRAAFKISQERLNVALPGREGFPSGTFKTFPRPDGGSVTRIEDDGSPSKKKLLNWPRCKIEEALHLSV